jgi:hypothetical protein
MTWMEAGRTVYAFADASDAAKVRNALEGQRQHPSPLSRHEGYWQFEVISHDGEDRT